MANDPRVEQHKARMIERNEKRHGRMKTQTVERKPVTRRIMDKLNERFEQTITNEPGTIIPYNPSTEAIIPYEPARPRIPAPTTSSRKGVYKVNDSIRILAYGG